MIPTRIVFPPFIGEQAALTTSLFVFLYRRKTAMWRPKTTFSLNVELNVPLVFLMMRDDCDFSVVFELPCGVDDEVNEGECF